jgi:hypothetical protein
MIYLLKEMLYLFLVLAVLVPSVVECSANIVFAECPVCGHSAKIVTFQQFTLMR